MQSRFLWIMYYLGQTLSATFLPPYSILFLLDFPNFEYGFLWHYFLKFVRKAWLRKLVTGHCASLADIAALSAAKPSWSCCYYEMASNMIWEPRLETKVPQSDIKTPLLCDQEPGPLLADLQWRPFLGFPKFYEWISQIQLAFISTFRA